MATFSHTSSRFFKTGLTVAAIVVALTGCSSGKWGFPYRANVQQGNWITQDQVALLRTGMTREQVSFVLGSPTLISVLHADRWDYPYYFKLGYDAPQERKFTVWFENNRLARWSGDTQPELQPFQMDSPNAELQTPVKGATDTGTLASTETGSTLEKNSFPEQSRRATQVNP